MKKKHKIIGVVFVSGKTAHRKEVTRLVEYWQATTCGYSKRKLRARAKAYIAFHGIKEA